MSKQSRLELLNGAREVYASKKTRKDKYGFLLEMQQLTGYKSTKTIIRVLSSTKEKPVKEKRGIEFSNLTKHRHPELSPMERPPP